MSRSSWVKKHLNGSNRVSQSVSQSASQLIVCGVFRALKAKKEDKTKHEVRSFIIFVTRNI